MNKYEVNRESYPSRARRRTMTGTKTAAHKHKYVFTLYIATVATVLSSIVPLADHHRTAADILVILVWAAVVFALMCMAVMSWGVFIILPRNNR